MVDPVRWLAVTLFAAVELGGAFGSASATVEDLGADSMIIELEVEITESAQAVVVHLSFEDDTAIALPLLDRGNGLFGIRTELEPKNYVAVFEAIGGGGAISQPFLLSELGADLTSNVGGAGSPPTTGDDSAISRGTQRYGWLALGLAAASLSALAFWVLGGRDQEVEAAAEEE